VVGDRGKGGVMDEQDYERQIMYEGWLAYKDHLIMCEYCGEDKPDVDEDLMCGDCRRRDEI
jgi:hypothetical protein